LSTNVFCDEDANSNIKSIPQLSRDQIKINVNDQIMTINSKIESLVSILVFQLLRPLPPPPRFANAAKKHSIQKTRKLHPSIQVQLKQDAEYIKNGISFRSTSSSQKFQRTADNNNNNNEQQQ
jgi:hypothetical protein